MKGILETLQNTGNHQMFIKLIKQSDREDFLNTQGPLTVFAPNNEAFDDLPKEALEDWLKKKEVLGEIIDYHLVGDEFYCQDLANLPSLETLQGEEVLIETLDKTIAVNDGAIIKGDLSYSNGVIHIIDALLIP